MSQNAVNQTQAHFLTHNNQNSLPGNHPVVWDFWKGKGRAKLDTSSK